MQIDPERLYQELARLGEIGAYTDDRTGLRGVNRLALTEADGAGRRHVVQSMLDLGLGVRIDKIGNVYARQEGREPGLAPVMIGSHVDSVPTAGRFDGCLGVLGGLEVLRTMAEAGHRPRRPIVVAFFTDEEGCRFGTDMLGSAVATGRLSLEQATGLLDAEGNRMGEELQRIGFEGEHPVELDPPYAYLEVHIEQGPVLRAHGVDLGIVTGVQGISWQELTILGRSAHAGTTPMELRRDAGLAAARINLFLHELTARIPGARATMGAIRPEPGLVNIVPGRVVCTVDLRNPDEALLAQAEAELAAFLVQVETLDGVQIEARQTARTPPVAFDPAIQARIEAAAKGLQLSTERIISGAGHDAQELARLCPTGMIFVPGEHEGISHNPRELSTMTQCGDGVQVLLRVVTELAEA